MPTIRLSVRELVEFLLRTGSIDSRFTGFFPAFDQEANLWLGEAAPREELLHGGQYAASILRTTLKAKDALLFLRM